jgi:hypothetical protein
VDGRVRLGLEGFSYVEAETLQEAAGELVAQLLAMAMAIRGGHTGPQYTECSLDPAILAFVWEVGELTRAGGDPRELLFGPAPGDPDAEPAG